MIIKCKNIYTENEIVDGYMKVEDGKIVSISTEEAEFDLDFSDKMIIPGIFDTHNHASGGYSVYGDNESDDQHYNTDRNITNQSKAAVSERMNNTENYLKVLASLGVTSVFPTLFATKVNQEEKDVIALTRNYIGKNVDGAKALGINFEGPFLNRTGEGADSYQPDPVDVNDLQDIIDIGQGCISEMGMAVELPNAEKGVELLLKNNITVAMAHTNGKSAEAFKAFDWGVSVATHTCNVMTGIHHRNIGALGAALMDERCYCELICDGLHVCNDMLKLVLRLKDHNKIMLISDSSRFVGFPPGTYDFDSYKVVVDEKGRVLEGEALNGSSKGVIYGIKNLVENCGIDLMDAIKMACRVPAVKYGFNNKGVLMAGMDADFVVINKDFNVVCTYVEGTKVYDCNIDKMVLNPKVMERKIA